MLSFQIPESISTTVLFAVSNSTFVQERHGNPQFSGVTNAWLCSALNLRHPRILRENCNSFAWMTCPRPAWWHVMEHKLKPRGFMHVCSNLNDLFPRPSPTLKGVFQTNSLQISGKKCTHLLFPRVSDHVTTLTAILDTSEKLHHGLNSIGFILFYLFASKLAADALL